MYRCCIDVIKNLWAELNKALDKEGFDIKALSASCPSCGKWCRVKASATKDVRI